VSETAKNAPASILHRLRNKARAEGRNAQDLLRYYAIERFLYRLSQSAHAERFVLKGALIFLAWGLDFPRPTRDIDLAGFVAGDVETMRSIMQDVCRTPVFADGMEYDAASVSSCFCQTKSRPNDDRKESQSCHRGVAIDN